LLDRRQLLGRARRPAVEVRRFVPLALAAVPLLELLFQIVRVGGGDPAGREERHPDEEPATPHAVASSPRAPIATIDATPSPQPENARGPPPAAEDGLLRFEVYGASVVLFEKAPHTSVPPGRHLELAVRALPAQHAPELLGKPRGSGRGCG
jgi:hypothetical protein